MTVTCCLSALLPPQHRATWPHHSQQEAAWEIHCQEHRTAVPHSVYALLSVVNDIHGRYSIIRSKAIKKTWDSTYNLVIIKRKDGSMSEREVFICLSTVNVTALWGKNSQHLEYQITLVSLKQWTTGVLHWENLSSVSQSWGRNPKLGRQAFFLR